MELSALVKGRSTIRRGVTNTIKMLNELLNKEPVDVMTLRVQFEMLQDSNVKLLSLDEQILAKMASEQVPDGSTAREDLETDPAETDESRTQNSMDTEYDKAQDYQLKIKMISAKVDDKLQQKGNTPPESLFSTAIGANYGGGSSSQRQYRLPKIKLRTFSGQVSDWLGWWSHFSKIHDDPEIREVDKFDYLSQSMAPDTRAKQLVDSYPMTTENYAAAIQSLTDRYGQEDLLIPHYIRELLKLVVQNATEQDKVPLSTLYDRIETDIRALGSLKVSTKEMGRFLHPIVESCLSEEVYTAWQRSSLYEMQDGNKSKLDFLLQFLSEESKREMKREARDFCLDSPRKITSKRTRVRKSSLSEDEPTVAGLAAQTITGKTGCIFCARVNHSSDSCYRARKMSYSDRRAKCIENRLCYACIRPGHRVANCSSEVRCDTCGGPHVHVMCMKSSNPKIKDDDIGVTMKLEELKVESTELSSLGVNAKTDVLLKTAKVNVINPENGKQVVVRVLFDSGSQKSYVTGRTMRALVSNPVSQEESRIILMNGTMTEFETTNHHEVVISSLTNKNKMNMRVRERRTIGGPTSRVPVGPWINSLRKLNIQLSDVEVEPGMSSVDVLIGQDYYEQCRTGRRVKVTDELFAVETIFGWTLCGTLPRKEDNTYSSNYCHEMSKLWDLEVLGIQDTAEYESKEEKDQRVKVDFQQSIKQNQDGRYVIKLPWRMSSPNIPTNYTVALKRLESMTRKLNGDDLRKYDEIFRSWLEEGIIQVVPQAEERQGFYLPHRPVIKVESLTTPMRPVFDASCRMGKHPSVNMLLETGVNMLEIIPSLLLKFRRFAVAGTADIRKAFQTIEVDEDDRNFQKFLWWKHTPGGEIVEFRHCRVVFGMTCSPFILAAVLDFHLSKGNKGIEKLLRDSLYVDNVVVSFRSVEEYHNFKESSTAGLAHIQMVLRQWESNVDLKMDSVNTSVLGLSWDKERDELFVKVPKSFALLTEEAITSRKVLSLVSQVFDPIGCACPATLQPRLLLQAAWRKELKWDETWDDADSEIFLKWVKEANFLSEIRLSRFAFKNEDNNIEIHVFCDASKTAYATVAFVRIEDADGVSVQFLMAKSRVAPLVKKNGKKITIPRLELLACTIGARMARTIKTSLQLKDDCFHFWSDSSTCIAWIQREEIWGVFVDNRVKEIIKITDRKMWKHVPGCANPADLPSRGCGVRELAESSWANGPSWLRLPKGEWPLSSVIYNEDEVVDEMRKAVVSNVALVQEEPRFSHFLKNVRVHAWIRRFIENSRREKTSRRIVHYLTFEELRQGELDLIRKLQNKYFEEEPKVSGFQVMKHGDGLWRLNTRLTYRDDLPAFKSPVILPNNDPLVEQLIRYMHETSYHAGTQYILMKLRERYWVIHGRKTVKKVVHKCMQCQRYRIKNLKSAPTPLPETRVSTAAAFQTTGVDLAGPIFLKGSKKAWIVLYTCAVYRGVHLDLIDSLSTESFLLSLERFVNTVGRPHTIYSDNGTNFVGAHNLMKRLNWDTITLSSEMKRIKFVHIVPSAPWWGGYWERLVRTTKDLLKKMLGKAKLTFEEMRTCLAGVQHVINERPLTEVTSDAGDLQPLTPSMFMRELPLSFPEGEILGSRFMGESYAKMQNLKTALQARFRKEYLGFLTSRNLGQGSKTPKVGAMVLVGDSNRKRFQWPLGRIVELFPGKDGRVRVARVKTSTGNLVRPLERLFPLETYEMDGNREGKVLKLSSDLAESHGVTINKVLNRSGRESKPPSRYGQWNF